MSAAISGVVDGPAAVNPLEDPQILAGLVRARLTIGVVTVVLAILGLNQAIGKGRAGAEVGWRVREFVVNNTNTNGSTLLLLLGIATIALTIAPRLLAGANAAPTQRATGFFAHGFLIIALAHLVLAGLGLYWWGHPVFDGSKKEIQNWLAADGRTVAVHVTFCVALCAINLTVFLVDRRESK